MSDKELRYMTDKETYEWLKDRFAKGTCYIYWGDDYGLAVVTRIMRYVSEFEKQLQSLKDEVRDLRKTIKYQP